MAEPSWKDKVPEVLAKIRPMLQRDGGDVELIEVTDDGVVKVALRGACHGCPMSQLTIRMGVEFELKKAIPEVTKVVSI